MTSDLETQAVMQIPPSRHVPKPTRIQIEYGLRLHRVVCRCCLPFSAGIFAFPEIRAQLASCRTYPLIVLKLENHAKRLYIWLSAE